MGLTLCHALYQVLHIVLLTWVMLTTIHQYCSTTTTLVFRWGNWATERLNHWQRLHSKWQVGFESQQPGSELRHLATCYSLLLQVQSYLSPSRREHHYKAISRTYPKNSNFAILRSFKSGRKDAATKSDSPLHVRKAALPTSGRERTVLHSLFSSGDWRRQMPLHKLPTGPH